jgi:hypothetical protein
MVFLDSRKESLPTAGNDLIQQRVPIKEMSATLAVSFLAIIFSRERWGHQR